MTRIQAIEQNGQWREVHCVGMAVLNQRAWCHA